MDFIHIISFWLHFIGLAAGGAASMGIPVVGAATERATPEQRKMLGELATGLARIGHIGLGLLILTGVAMVSLADGGLANLNAWFWVKMALVLALIGAIVLSGRTSKRAMAGDPAAQRLAPKLGMLSLALLLGILLSAVLSFG